MFVVMEDVLDLSTPRICTDCGEEVECGLMNTINHANSCKKNAPNENIEVHHEEVKWKQRQKERTAEEKILYPKLNQQEQERWMLYSMIRMCGSKLAKEIEDFYQEMKSKYL